MTDVNGNQVFPDVHHKMSKKIAQLTKVIYHLNTRNEDFQYQMQSLADSYESEIEEVCMKTRKLPFIYIYIFENYYCLDGWETQTQSRSECSCQQNPQPTPTQTLKPRSSTMHFIKSTISALDWWNARMNHALPKPLHS